MVHNAIQPVLGAVVLSLLAGCAIGPTPEERARIDQAQRELEAKREAQYEQSLEEERLQKIELQRTLSLRQKEVRSNVPGAHHSSENIVQANKLLKSINTDALQALQTDSWPFSKTSEISANKAPLFLLDEATGKLTLQLTQTQTRELMLRHVQKVRTYYYNTIDNAINKNASGGFHEVVFNMGGDGYKVVHANNNGEYSWKANLRVRANDAATAERIESSLKELVAIYKESRYLLKDKPPKWIRTPIPNNHGIKANSYSN